jgi:toxin ParE1/3/4
VSGTPAVLLRPRAERDLADLYAYVAERDGDDRALAVLRRFEEAMARRAAFPLSGRARDDLRPGLRSFPVGGWVVFYRPLADGILVTRVLRGERDLPPALAAEDA